MKQGLLLFGLLSGLLFGVSPVSAEQETNAVNQVGISHPYARAVPPGQPNSAVFMHLQNTGDSPRAIVSADSPVAEVVELHTHTLHDGVMQMRQIPKIEIPANGAVELKPGGLHIMLIRLKQPLVPDRHINLGLVFDDDSRVELTVPVKKIGMEPGHHPGHEHGDEDAAHRHHHGHDDGDHRH